MKEVTGWPTFMALGTGKPVGKFAMVGVVLAFANTGHMLLQMTIVTYLVMTMEFILMRTAYLVIKTATNKGDLPTRMESDHEIVY